MSDPFMNSDSQRELAHRVSGGIEVTLYWNAGDNTTSVEVFQEATGVTLRLGVPRERALDAFYHPFAHVNVAGVPGVTTAGMGRD
jgi:hypothetical protein